MSGYILVRINCSLQTDRERKRDKISSRAVNDILMFILVRIKCSLQTDRERKREWEIKMA